MSEPFALVTCSTLILTEIEEFLVRYRPDSMDRGLFASIWMPRMDSKESVLELLSGGRQAFSPCTEKTLTDTGLSGLSWISRTVAELYHPNMLES